MPHRAFSLEAQHREVPVRSGLLLTLSLAVFVGLALPTIVLAVPGRIVMSHDDWAFTETAFASTPDAAAYVAAIASWFTDGAPGSFIGFGWAFHLGAPQLSPIFESAGHTYSRSDATSFALEELQAYDGVFLGAWPFGEDGNAEILRAYVEGGGNVYLYGGTNFYGSIGADSAVLNSFLQPFGLAVADQIDGFQGVISVDSAHPVLAGVDSLYADFGTEVFDTHPADPRSAVVGRSGSVGVVAVFDGRVDISSVGAAPVVSRTLSVFPNPGGPSFRFVLPSGAEPCGQVDIFALDGRRLRRLAAVSGNDQLGNAFVWDGLTGDGARASAGVYFARPVRCTAQPVHFTLIR
jgi:hypothetical protein